MTAEEVMEARRRHGLPTRVTLLADCGSASVWAYNRIQAECAAALELGVSLWDVHGAQMELAKEVET